MSLPPLAGHEDLRARLLRSVSAGRLPGSLLFHGPPGVGKQRLALWLGQALLCREETACGSCRGCRLARRLEHPDLHWFFPLPRPSGAGSREKLREKLEDARMEELDRRREEPLEPAEPEGATGIYLAAVDEMRARASRRPAMGPRSVFVVGDAEAMVPQAASPQAANAFLKLLEEPPEDTFVLLTSSRRGSLLPTVRSRTLSLRVSPLETRDVAAFLHEQLGLQEDDAAAAARRSHGSIGRAIRELSEEGEGRRDEARRFLEAAFRAGRKERMGYAAGVSPSGARGGFSSMLATAGELLRDVLALRLGHRELTFDPEAARSLVGDDPPAAHRLVEAFGHVQEAREEASGNVNPQAITASLLSDLASDLRGRGGR